MKISLLLSIFLVLVAIASSDNSKDREECADSLVGLATCLPYVEGNAKIPTPDCCTGLKQVLANKKKCLCVVIKDRNDPDLGLTINVTLALGLPRVCNAKANISQCPALLNLPPNSPDAQIFYQYGQKSSNVSGAPAISPVSGGPRANATIGRPVGTGPAGGTAQRSNDGRRNMMKWFGVEILGRVVFLWVLSFFIM